MKFVKSDTDESPIIVETYIAAMAEDAFRAWTDPDIVKKWFGPKPNFLRTAEIDLQPGGRWRFVEEDTDEHIKGFEGEYIEISRPHLLHFSWYRFSGPKGALERTERSTVTIEIIEQTPGVTVRVTHAGIQDMNWLNGFRGGWEAGFAAFTDYLSATG